MAMLETFISVSRAVANQVQASLAVQAPNLAQGLDLPQRQRFVELLARGFEAFVHGLERATREVGAQSARAASQTGVISFGPRSAGEEEAATNTNEDEEAFARKFAQLFLDMGGIFPKLAQVLSLRPDLIKSRAVLLRLRAVQEECNRRPFEEAKALVMAESAAFRDGRYQLKDWPQYVHAGSIAQVAPFVAVGTPEDGQVPDGVVKLTFHHMREVMEVDFRLMRSQLHWMERTGEWTRAAPGLAALQPRNISKLREVWRVMVGMEREVLQEFNLRHEAECQAQGALLLEGLLGPQGEYPWLEEWREAALSAALRPAGPELTSQAQEAWRAGLSRPGGWLSRMARRAYLGRATANEISEGEQHIARLRAALRSLRVRVPEVLPEASGPHVLSMALADGRSLKEILDVAAQGQADAAQKAAAWFASLLLLVLVPLWGKMLLTVGCCHADPHPGNFKVSGIPGLEDSPAPRAAQPGFVGRFLSGPAQPQPPPPSLTLWVLDWGSCIDLGEDLRQTLCRLVLGVAELRVAQRRREAGDATAEQAEADATHTVATCARVLGLQSDDEPFLAALGMALFDPSIAGHHPHLSHGEAEEALSRGIRMGSAAGKVLRVIAILVGLCRELEARLNEEVAGRVQTAQPPFVELFLVELWRPFAEEGLA